MSRLPTFMVVGAAKSSTTSLHYSMEQHPEICVTPCKETYTAAGYGESLSFEEALEDEQNSIDQKVMFMGHDLSQGLSYRSVKHYLENFSQTRVYLLEDLKERPPKILREIFQFIGVDGGFKPDDETTFNPSGIPRSRQRQKAMRLLMGRNRADRLFHTMPKYNLKRVPMKSETRPKLVDIYREDVRQLQELIGRDPSHWLDV